MSTKKDLAHSPSTPTGGGEAFYKKQLEIANKEKSRLQERLRQVESKNALLLKSLFELTCQTSSFSAPIDVVQALKKLSTDSQQQAPGLSGKGSAYRRSAPTDRSFVENATNSGLSTHTNPAYTPFRCRAELKAHSSAVYAIQFSPNGQLLASTSFDRSVCFWPMDRFLDRSNYDPKLIVTDAHRAPCVAVEWTFDSARVVTGGLDATVAEWDVQSASCEAISRFHCNGLVNAVSVSPATDALFFVGTARNAVHLFDRRVAVPEHDSSWESTTLVINDGAVNSIHVTLDGMRFITGDHCGAIKTFDLRMVGPARSDDVGRRTSSLIDVTYNDENRRPITHVHTSPPTSGEDYGRFMAVNSYDNYLRVYDRGSFLFKGEKPELKPVHSLVGLHNTHWPIKSSFFLGADYRPPRRGPTRSVRSRKTRSAERRGREAADEDMSLSSRDRARGLSADEDTDYSNDSSVESERSESSEDEGRSTDEDDIGGPIQKSLILASGSADSNVYVFDVGGRSGTGKLLQRLEGHKDRVYGVDFHPNEPILVSCSADSEIKIWQSFR